MDVTPEAAEVLKRSLELGGVEAGGGIRLRAARALGGGVDVQVELAGGPQTGETTIEREGIRLFVDPDIFRSVPNPIVALEPQHETIVVRPRDDTTT